MTTRIHHVSTSSTGIVELTITDACAGRPFLLLHGGGGPQSIAAFASLLAPRGTPVS